MKAIDQSVPHCYQSMCHAYQPHPDCHCTCRFCVPEEPPVGTWVRDKHGAVSVHIIDGDGNDGWAPSPFGFYACGQCKSMWRARGPFVVCGPWGNDNDNEERDSMASRKVAAKKIAARTATPLCEAEYGTGDEDAPTAVCKRPAGHPSIAEDGIGHAPVFITTEGTTVDRCNWPKESCICGLNHVDTHPEAGCGDVGCDRSHDEPEKVQKWRARVPLPDTMVEFMQEITGVGRIVGGDDTYVDVEFEEADLYELASTVKELENTLTAVVCQTIHILRPKPVD